LIDSAIPWLNDGNIDVYELPAARQPFVSVVYVHAHDTTILSQNMLKLFVSPETYRIDFAGMDKNPGFSQEHGGFAGSMLIYQGVLCAFV
jgi:hypothetical protein